MNVMLDFCVIPACLAKSQNDTPYCSDYHQAYDRASNWKFACRYHYVILENFTDGPVFLSPWEKSPDWDHHPEGGGGGGVSFPSPVVGVTYEQEQEQEVLQEQHEEEEEVAEEGERKRRKDSDEEKGKDKEKENVALNPPGHVRDRGSSSSSSSSSGGGRDRDSRLLVPRGLQHTHTHSRNRNHGLYAKASAHAREEVHSGGECDDRVDIDDDDEDDNGRKDVPLSSTGRSFHLSDILDEHIDHDDSDDDTDYDNDNGDDVDDEILEFSQSVREEGLAAAPAYLHKKMRMNDSLFNKRATRESGAERHVVGYETHNNHNRHKNNHSNHSNQLALSVVPRHSIGTQKQRRQQPSGDTSSSFLSDNNSNSSHNSSHNYNSNYSNSQLDRGSSEQGARRLMSPPAATVTATGSGRNNNNNSNGNNHDCRRNNNSINNSNAGSVVRNNSKAVMSPTGLAWSDDARTFRKVSLASTNKEFSKKKRARQTKLVLQPQKRR